FVQIPTTFLAQIDSSVGGKTAVNIESGKNLVGAFWQPILVICDIDTLKTLPPDRFADGVGEAIKYGAIIDKTLFELIEQGGLSTNLLQIVTRCIEIKRDVVEKDEFDLGLRQLLNFGHTIGHAIEKCSHFAISHGKAVGIGMNMITTLSEKVKITPNGCAKRIETLLKKCDMPTECKQDANELLDVITNDKKVANGTINLIVLKEIGNAIIHNISLDKLEDFFNGR
ncbi:MAG: 3-dehydroquinate synthase, partial [Oscillospiraceae bacterium]|nr:3-dehydroquinate synthase [Oscillospiraceae bacterium]